MVWTAVSLALCTALLVAVLAWLRAGATGRVRGSNSNRDVLLDVLKGSVGIGTASVAAAAVFTILSPAGLDARRMPVRLAMDDARTARIERISPRRAAELLAGGAVALDARPLRDWAAGHVPGARSLNPGVPEAWRLAVLRKIEPGATLILYCSGSSCALDRSLAQQLLADGWTNLLRIEGGIEAWADAGLPMETASLDEIDAEVQP